MAEEIVAIRIIPDGVGVSDTGQAGGGAGIPSSSGGVGTKGFLGGMGNVLSGVLKGLGIGALVSIVISAISANKGLMSVLKNIMKTISFLLKPITDVVMVLLMPILMILKPIMILANQVMAPFLKLAMQLMREGQSLIAGGDVAGGTAAFAGAGAVALQGLSAVLVAVSAELIKLIIDMVGQLLAVVVNSLVEFGAWLVGPILSVFGVSQEEINAGVDNIQAGISQGFLTATQALGSVVDVFAGSTMALLASSSAMIAESFDVDTTEFKDDAVGMITNVFSGAGGLEKTWGDMIGTGSGFGKVANDAIKDVMGEGEGISGTFGTAMDDFKTEGVKKINGAVTAFNTAWDNLKSGSFGSSAGSFSQVVKDTVVEVVTLGFGKTETYNGDE